MTKLSVNINKIAVVRNSRGGNMPDVVRAALDIERFGADGITVHPRPDARHIRYDDVRDLKRVLTTELNVEGNPIPSFVDLVLEVVPAQVTLVPDAHDAITSNAGWDTLTNRDFLTGVAARFHEKGIRVSVFVDPDPAMVAGAKACGADRVELYTEAYAREYPAGADAALAPDLAAAEEARRQGLGLRSTTGWKTPCSFINVNLNIKKIEAGYEKSHSLCRGSVRRGRIVRPKRIQLSETQPFRTVADPG